jgi:PLP dependent protein
MKKSGEQISPEQMAANLARIQTKIVEAAAKAGRRSQDVKLIAVTKYVGVSEVRALYDLGVRDFGESRVQDLEKKIQACPQYGKDPVRWHLIGHLQTNKADKAVRLFETIHSIDSIRVALALNKEREKAKLPPLPCLIEVNVAGEQNKFGLAPQISDLTELLKNCAALSAIKIVGLMCMAPHAEIAEPTSRPVFRKLRELMAQANASATSPSPLTELSMGMTQDFDIAIEEGATSVRVGSALFE